MKVALIYDRVNKMGGAERIIMALHRIFPNAPLYTSVYSPKSAGWAEELDVRPSFLRKVKWAQDYNELLAILMPVSFESFSFDNYDVVISVTSEGSKGVITKPQTLHICYCLTPTRYLWSGYKDYFKSPLLDLISRPAVSYLRSWDKMASSRPDHYVSISNEVKKRVKKYYNRDSSVIYPPILLEKKPLKIQDKDYFLMVSRLSRFSYYKKVDLVIEAFNKSKIPLKIVGTGSMEASFKRKAGKNIEFLGRLTDEELSSYYAGCKALIFPAHEDFGLVMAEAQSFGKPVIAFRGGGALEIIEEGVTGEFFDEQNASSLLKSLEKFSQKRYNKADIIKNSERFSFDRFNQEFSKLFEEKTKEYFSL